MINLIEIVNAAKGIVNSTDELAMDNLKYAIERYEREPLYKHVKTGGIYQIICNANKESDGTLQVVYRNISTEDRYVRPAAEFFDGRFLKLEAVDV